MSELFRKLESADKEEAESAKQQLREQFKNVNDSWLLNGVYDYYLRTDSARIMEILVTITEPHHQFLYERLSESLRSSESKVQALTLLGYVARTQPTWLYTLPDHQVFQGVLRVLRNETQLLPLISALLLVIVLLPALPTRMAQHLSDLLDVFSRLASWPHLAQTTEEQRVHMQVTLYALFLRLYGMFPCNFLAFLRSHYKDRGDPVFLHTVRPMLASVRMNPALVTASRDHETTTERWRRQQVHDVIVECDKYSLELTDRCSDNCNLGPNCRGFRSRSNTSSSVRSLKAVPPIVTEQTFFSPSALLQPVTPPVVVEGTSPPEAAIEATPETTPIRDLFANVVRPVVVSSTAARNLTHSQPSSPMRRTEFHYPKLGKLISDREAMCQSPALTQEDEEVSQIVSNLQSNPIQNRCDSVLPEFDDVLPQFGTNLEDVKGSPCTEGGLHVLNTTSIKQFYKRLSRRIKNREHCVSECEQVQLKPVKLVLRRTSSWPNLHSTNNANSTKSAQNVPIDTTSNLGDLYETKGTQTDSFLPYEFLFLSIFPNVLDNDTNNSTNSTPTLTATNSTNSTNSNRASLYDVLDKYIEAAVTAHDKDNSAHFYRDQLQLIHQQLLFERHRRETHAYKNRRLLSDAKNTRLLEDCNLALREQVQLHQNEIDSLRKQLVISRQNHTEEQGRLASKLQNLEGLAQIKQAECRMLKESNQQLQKDLSAIRTRNQEMDVQLQNHEAQLFNAIAEANIAKEQAFAGEKNRIELEQVQKDLLQLGELHLKSQERLNNLNAAKQWQQENKTMHETYLQEVHSLQLKLQQNIALGDAYKARISEFEQQLEAKENLLSVQRKQLASVAEENAHKIQSVESKYCTQLKINRALEEKLLEARQELAKRAVNSPDTSSCHEVNVTTTAGLSAHSSPLSASLASSEGSAFHDVREVKNLHLADAKKVVESPDGPSTTED